MPVLKVSHCFICDEISSSLKQRDGWMTHINQLYQQTDTVVNLEWENCRMCRPYGSPEKTMCRVHINWNDFRQEGVAPNG